MECSVDLGSHPLYCIFTSGSSGIPKAVEVDDMNLCAYISNIQHALGMTELSRVLCVSSPTFDPALGDVFATLTCGATLLCPSSHTIRTQLMDSSVFGSFIPTSVIATPSLWRQIRAIPSWWSKETKVCLGGEAMSAAIVDFWSTQCELYNIFGVTEATVYQSLHRIHTIADTKVIGVPFRGLEFTVLEDGELCIRGPQV
eukprot:PhF_6_TR35439/c0_g1_i3/m.51665